MTVVRWIYSGISHPNALYRKLYRGVELKYSMPRITWVMPIRWSSITLAKL